MQTSHREENRNIGVRNKFITNGRSEGVREGEEGWDRRD